MNDELEIRKVSEADPLEEKIQEMETLAREDGIGNGEVGAIAEPIKDES